MSTRPEGSNALQLYSLDTPNGQKIGIALEEMGLNYDVHVISIMKNTQFEDWFVKVRVPSMF